MATVPASPAASSSPPASGAATPSTPFGGSPAVSPTPNKGFEAAGKQKLAIAIQALTAALPMLGAASEDGQIVLDCLRKLGKLAQPGEVSPAGEQNQLRQMMIKAVQNSQQNQKLQQPPQAGGQPAQAA